MRAGPLSLCDQRSRSSGSAPGLSGFRGRAARALAARVGVPALLGDLGSDLARARGGMTDLCRARPRPRAKGLRARARSRPPCTWRPDRVRLAGGRGATWATCSLLTESLMAPVGVVSRMVMPSAGRTVSATTPPLPSLHDAATCQRAGRRSAGAPLAAPARRARTSPLASALVHLAGARNETPSTVNRANFPPSVSLLTSKHCAEESRQLLRAARRPGPARAAWLPGRTTHLVGSCAAVASLLDGLLLLADQCALFSFDLAGDLLPERGTPAILPRHLVHVHDICDASLASEREYTRDTRWMQEYGSPQRRQMAASPSPRGSPRRARRAPRGAPLASPSSWAHTPPRYARRHGAALQLARPGRMQRRKGQPRAQSRRARWLSAPSLRWE